MKLSAPDNVTVTPGEEKLKVSWSEVTGAGSYKVQWKSGSESYDSSRQATPSGTEYTYTISGLTGGVAYTLRVAAVKQATSEEGMWAEATGTPQNRQAAQQVALAASRVTRTTALLTISNYPGNWYYKYTSPTGGQCSPVQTEPTATVTGLTPGTSYTFKAYGDSNCSTAVLASSPFNTQAAAATAPAAPSRPVATAGVSSVSLSWSSGDDGGSAVTGWQYRQKAGSGDYGAWTDMSGSGADTTRFTIAGLANGTAYRFRVRAVNAVGPGAAAPESASATPGTTVPNRLVRVNEAIAPELSRAIASSSVQAVAGRIGQAASGETEDALASFAHVLGTHGEAWADGTVSWREALHGASFAHAFSAADGGGLPGGLGLWGAGDWRRLSGGGEGAVKWDGSVGMVHLGADARLGRKLLGGLAVSLAEGSFDYSERSGNDRGSHETRMTGVSPYAGRLLADGSRLWTMLGYGAGNVDIDDGEARRQSADSTMKTVAAGGSLAVLSGADSGISSAMLSVVGDAMLSRFEIEDNGDLIRGMEAWGNFGGPGWRAAVRQAMERRCGCQPNA